MHLVMLETNGNQRFIFSSPRLRDGVGASSLLTKLEQWTAHELLATGAAAAWRTACGLPDDREPHESQWVSKSSGKVIFLVDSAQQAKDVISAVTRKALAEAPGMDVSGVFIRLPASSGSQPGPVYVTESALKEVHAEAARYALRRSPAEARFSQLPFLSRAKDSSLPASPPLAARDEAKDDRQDALSLTSRVRRYRAYRARLDLLETGVKRSSDLSDKQALLTRDPTMLAKKLHQVFVEGIEPVGDEGRPEPEENVARGAEELRPLEHAIQSNPDASSTTGPDTGSGDYTFLSKVAVIHIDGNGVGGIMKELNDSKDRVDPGVFKKNILCDRDDPDALRRFLLKVNERLENSVIQAFVTAWRDVANWACRRTGREHTAIPVVPVILGGDDVTVITSGDYALPFAASFLAHFEKQTEEDGLLKYLHGVDKVATGELQPEDVIPAPMTAAAGVAIVRRNFPFHIAYELAEKLVGRAKGVGKNENPPCSTLDFHVLFDTTVIDPDGQLGGYKDLSTRPFCFVERAPDAASESFPQAPATWEDTCRRVARFRGFRDPDDTDDRTEPFPRTRAARIRKLLSDGKRDEAMKHWNAAKDKTGTDLDKELGDLTALFDLLELADLLPDSYLQETTGLTPPEASTNPTSTPAEALS